MLHATLHRREGESEFLKSFLVFFDGLLASPAHPQAITGTPNSQCLPPFYMIESLMCSWWSRTNHPLFPPTQAKSFVDQCEKHAGKGNSDEQKLRQQQWDDLKRIVEWTRENSK
jgi:hypothetical protein